MLVTSAWLRSDNQMRTRLSYISWLSGWDSGFEEQSKKTKSQNLTCPGPQSDQRIRSPVGNHDHWPVWPTHFTSTQWLQFLDIKQKSDKSARIFGDYSQDLNLSLSLLTKFQSCRLLSTTIHIREDINEKNIFFRALPESPNPPPWPEFGQLGPLFSEVEIQDLKISLELRILYILYNILHISNLNNS